MQHPKCERMKMKWITEILVILGLFFPCISKSQTGHAPARYTGKGYFKIEEIQTETDAFYGTAQDWKGRPDTQYVNLFYPNLNVDSLKRRPFIMLLHGGGLRDEDEKGQKNQWNTFCYELAQRGFAAATIDYRVGWDEKSKENLTKENLLSSATIAAYRAYQDARAALRYFVHHAAAYGIDTNNLFIGGRSAGGDISLVTAFLSQQNIDSLSSLHIPVSGHELLGSLDEADNTLTDKFKIRGVINMWGPIPDTSFISRAEAASMPILMFHGTNDDVVPYKRFYSAGYPYSRDGSYNIAQRYKHLGGCYELNTKIDGGHGQDFTNEFLAVHIADFITNVMNNHCISSEQLTSLPLKTKIKSLISSVFFIPVSLCSIIILILTGRFIIVRKNKN